MPQTAKQIRFFNRLLGIMALSAWLILLSPLMANAVQAATNAAKPSEDAAATAPTEQAEPQAITPGLAGSFLSSRFAKTHQDIHEAAKHLTETLSHDPKNVRLQHEVMRINLLAGDVNAAIALAKKLSAEAKGDALISTLLMLDAVKHERYKEAAAYVSEAPGGGLYGIVRPVITQWLAIAAGDVVGSVDMQGAIDKAGFFAPFLTYHMALMNDVLGNDHAALESYTNASSDPETTPYRVVEAVANFQMRQGKWKEAQAVFDHYAAANPDSSLLPDALVPTDREVRPLVADAQEGLAEVFFTTASILFGEDAAQDTFLYLRVALDLRPEFPPAQLMLANLYEQSGDYVSAMATYDAMDPASVFYRRGQVRKALNLEALGKRSQAIRALDELAKKHPRDSLALITKGDMQRDNEEYKDAAATYGAAIKRSEPLSKDDWPLLYARGISYERAGEWPKAEADFIRALALEPNQPDVLNYLGYSWLTLNKNIVQAREYLEVALSARPDDAHIIDSVGWAHYLAGDFKHAVTKFEKAVELMPSDPTVNDHLGDAYWRVGRETEARFQWNRALQFKPEKTTAHEIKRKLNDGLPAFLDQQSAIAKPAPTASEVHADMPFARQVQ